MSHQQKRLVLGADGGGTKTHALLMLEDGEIIAEREFPGTNPHTIDEDTLSERIGTLFSEISKMCRISPNDIDAACFGMAGCDREEDRQYLHRIISKHLPGETSLHVVNDAVAAMVAVIEKLDGLLVISGTGSICLGANELTGRMLRAGGWGHILSDEGGGYSIAIEGLRAIVKAYDGRGEPTSLTSKFLKHFQYDETTDLVGWIYEKKPEKAKVAVLARYVHEADEEGDPVATAILDQEARDLFAFVPAVYHRLQAEGEPRGLKLGLWGSNLLKNEAYRRRFLTHLRESGLALEPVMKETKAAIGAAQYALRKMSHK